MNHVEQLAYDWQESGNVDKQLCAMLLITALAADKAEAEQSSLNDLVIMACDAIHEDGEGGIECNCCHMQLNPDGTGHRRECLANALLEWHSATLGPLLPKPTPTQEQIADSVPSYLPPTRGDYQCPKCNCRYPKPGSCPNCEAAGLGHMNIHGCGPTLQYKPL